MLFLGVHSLWCVFLKQLVRNQLKSDRGPQPGHVLCTLLIYFSCIYLVGDALLQMGAAEPASKSGEVCVSPETWERIKDRCHGSPTDSGTGVMVVNEVVKPVPTKPSVRRWKAWSIPEDMKPIPSIYEVRKPAIH